MNNIHQLHNDNAILLIGNAWDALSALIMEQQGYKIIGTTSWGVANSLGYSDGEKIAFEVYVEVIQKIMHVISIPLSVDIESGFASDDEAIIDNVKRLAEIGCAGINIEDSFKDYSLKQPDEFALLLKNLRKALDSLGHDQFFINARIDTYVSLKENQLEATIQRARLYEDAGANGIFVPLLSSDEDIKELLGHLSTPLNVMSLPQLTDIKHVESLGVKRFSFGNAMSDYMIAAIEKLSQQILKHQNTAILYEHNGVKSTFK